MHGNWLCTIRCGPLALVFVAYLSATPRLRLSSSTDSAIIAQGTNGPAGPVATVTNIGDGQLNLTVTSSASWVTGVYGLSGQNGCNDPEFGDCIAVTYNAAGLAPGLYTAVLTVSGPNALDTPQTITVTLSVGSTVPDQLSPYAPPGGVAFTYFPVIAPLDFTWAADWIELDMIGEPITGFTAPVLFIVSTVAGDLPVGDYQGNFTLSDSSYVADNKTVAVDFHVTTGPIADAIIAVGPPVNPSVTFTASLPTGQNAAQTQFYEITNAGLGELAITDIDIATDTGSWLSATPINVPGGVGVAITADPTSLAAGVYNGTVTVNSNAANSPTVVPVELDVIAQGTPPAIYWPRILNIANFKPGEALAPGDIAAVYGIGMAEGDPIIVTTLPLPTQVGTGNTQVLVNGVAAPIFYTSYGQVNIQIPFETSVAQDAELQVVRNGITSPIGTVPIAARAPQILEFGCVYTNDCGYEGYAIGVNFSDGSFPLPATAPFPNCHPAKVGDVITFYGVGFGQTTNPLQTGVGAPSSPLPSIDPNYQFCFGYQPGDNAGVCTPASYSGASPGSVGLYQIDVTLPPVAYPGDSVSFYITNGESYSDPVYIAVQ